MLSTQLTLRDAHIMDVIFQREQPDVVIHGAAETFVDTSLRILILSLLPMYWVPRLLSTVASSIR